MNRELSRVISLKSHKNSAFHEVKLKVLAAACERDLEIKVRKISR